VGGRGLRRSVLAMEGNGINQSSTDGLIEKFSLRIELAYAYNVE